MDIEVVSYNVIQFRTVYDIEPIKLKQIDRDTICTISYESKFSPHIMGDFSISHYCTDIDILEKINSKLKIFHIKDIELVLYDLGDKIYFLIIKLAKDIAGVLDHTLYIEFDCSYFTLEQSYKYICDNIADVINEYGYCDRYSGYNTMPG